MINRKELLSKLFVAPLLIIAGDSSPEHDYWKYHDPEGKYSELGVPPYQWMSYYNYKNPHRPFHIRIRYSPYESFNNNYMKIGDDYETR